MILAVLASVSAFVAVRLVIAQRPVGALMAVVAEAFFIITWLALGGWGAGGGAIGV